MTPNHGLSRRVQEFGAYLMTAKDMVNMNPRCPDTWVLGPVSSIVSCICDLLSAPNWIEKPDMLPLNFKQHIGVIGGLRRIERSKSSRIDNDVLFQGLKSFCCVLPPNKTII